MVSRIARDSGYTFIAHAPGSFTPVALRLLLIMSSYENKRQHTRRRILKEGKIVSADMQSVFAVKIRDLNDGGALARRRHRLPLHKFAFKFGSDAVLVQV